MPILGVSVVFRNRILIEYKKTLKQSFQEYCETSRNFSVVVQRLLDTHLNTINSVETNFQKSFPYDEKWLFHILKKNNIICICMTENKTQENTAIYSNAYGFLNELSDAFWTKYKTAIESAPVLGMNDGYQRELKGLIQKYNSGQGLRTDQIRGHISDTMDKMVENIDLLLERESRIETLLQSTQEMEYLGGTFQKKATAVKNKYWWKNVRLWACFCTIGIIVILILVLVLLLSLKIIPTPGGL